MFFTFEGGEGVGKTTLISALQLSLVAKGFSVLVTREPGGTFLGKKIRQLLLDHPQMEFTKKAELFLFLADRAQHVEELIQPFLDKGGIVLCDRFFDSSLAYQSKCFSFDRLFELNLYATGGLRPDKTFYLDLDPLIGMQRIVKERTAAMDRIETKPLSYHQEVRESFLELVEKFSDRFIKIDAAQSKESVYNAVFNIITSLVDGKSASKYSS